MKILFKYLFVLVSLLFSFVSNAQKTPKEVFQFEPGSDFNLADYKMLTDYYKQLADASNHIVYKEIGKSVLGRPLILLIISSEENIKNLDKYKKIAKEMAQAKISKKEAVTNLQTGKAVVWLDAGLHATERATAQMMPLLAHDLATSDKTEYKKIRNNVITLLMPVMNPDGLDIVVDWYKKNLGTAYETTSPPWLYHHFVGHDNNRLVYE